jgi:predicted PurR-regulated permease PerM
MLRNSELPIDALVRITLIAFITYWSFSLISPMLSVLTWSIILAVALYPAFKWLNIRLGHRPLLAASFITIVNLFLLVGTLMLLTSNMISTLDSVTETIRNTDHALLQPNPSVQKVPVIGQSIYDYWSSAQINVGEFLKKYSEEIIKITTTFVSKLVLKGLDLLLFIFSVLLSGYFMTKGNHFAGVAKKIADRLTNGQGTDLLTMMTATIQNVSRGVIGVALIQTLFFGLLLILSDVPGAGLLSFLALILCIAQAGLFLIAIPVAIWFFFVKSFVVACVLTVLLALITLLDTFLKPIMLAHGLATPMMVIFIGVIGGMLMYGLLGVFIGPVILAVFYDLVKRWVEA